MCGLAGYAGVQDPDKRLMLVYALGLGIDKRGGDAAGYVTLGTGKGPRYARKSGEWGDARERFVRVAAQGNITMMHSRWATCGKKKAVEHAHPFAIKREVDGKKTTVLWGAHNGVVQSWQSAKKHNREIEVDSQELLELIADKDYEGLRDIAGYGVLTWIEKAHLKEPRVSLVRLSSNSEIEVWELEEGGYVWASTRHILEEACKVADLHCKNFYRCEDVGQVIWIYPDHIQFSGEEGVHLYRWTSKSPIWQPQSTTSIGTHGWSGHQVSDDNEEEQYSEYWRRTFNENVDGSPVSSKDPILGETVVVTNDGPVTKTRIVAL